ncbi:MAG: anhydro-N-acetylmuramic acid kinase [Gammaproteobacteria bacterium]|nr:anhydro-N-acetylmuramic acid kinase [Gammaproteobacteria bacterium]
MSAHQYFIGLMSGTSMDAIDAVLVQFETGQPQVLAHYTQPWNDSLRTRLRSLSKPGDNEIERLGVLDGEVANAFVSATKQLLKQSSTSPESVVAIGSHGQTIRHRPEASIPFTLQIGDPNRIAELTGITVVADFRRRDMAAGGEGAPLVPAFHRALFQQPGESLAILNIGGIANLTLLSANTDQPVSGFDTGPGNTLLDAWCHRHLQQPMDENGDWATRGTIDQSLLTDLLDDPYFKRPPPKSTGPEYFSLEWLEKHLESHPGISAVCCQATLLTLTVETVAMELDRGEGYQRLLVCGGGVHNRKLMTELRCRLPEIAVESTLNYGLDPDLVEATAFAWLAKRTLQDLPGNLPAVTGAERSVVLGGIYPA